MAKLQKKSPATSGERLKFREIASAMESCRKQRDWLGVMKLAATPPTAIDEIDPGIGLRAWLNDARLDANLEAMRQARAQSDYYDVPAQERDWVRETLKVASSEDEDFCLRDEFQLLLAAAPMGPEGALFVYPSLRRACEKMPDRLDLLQRLIGRIRTLQNNDAWEDDRRVEFKAIEQLGDLNAVIAERLAVALQSSSLSERDHMILRVLQLDDELRQAEPWDYPSVAIRIAALPTPQVESDAALTPQAWAFLAEAGLTAGSADGAELLRRYPLAGATRSVQGLAQLLEWMATGAQDESKFVRALSALIEHASDGGMLSSSILVQLSDGPNEIPFSHWASIEITTPADALIRLVERLPKDFARVEEMVTTAMLISAAADFGEIEEAWTPRLASETTNWLIRNVPGFRASLVDRHPDASSALLLSLDEAYACLERGMDLEGTFVRDFAEAYAAVATLDKALERIRAIALSERTMGPTLQKYWLEVMPATLRACAQPEIPMALCEKAAEVAGIVDGDLRRAGRLAHAAWLAHRTGDHGGAAAYYIEIINGDDTNAEWARKNLIGMLSRITERDELDEIADQLEAWGVTPSSGAHKKAVADALAACRRKLQEQDQFERTAVARWPTLTAPARKLLTTLSLLEGYKSHAELGQYAGMPEEWVERHFNKLVDLGMIFLIDNKFRINQHIEPLLDREKQHRMIGRIIRADGTSAVKQVFNSEREFSIYKIMVQLCPNHLIFPNCALQSFMQFDRMKELSDAEDFSYFLRASVDLLVVSTTTFLPMLAIEVDSVWHDTETQQQRDDRKDRLFAKAGVPFLRLRPVGSPSEDVIRGQVAHHVNELVRSLRADLPGYEQARQLLTDLARTAPS